MSSKPPSESTVIFWRKAVLVSIALVVLPPLPGMAITVFGMIRAFNDASATGMEDPAALSNDVSRALTTTAAGLVVSFVGLICLIVSLVRYLTLLKRYKAIP